MMIKSLTCVAILASLAAAQRDYTTPVPILKQLNRHNDDGSYSYGYEGADGSFKIETKYPNGEVYGKYGYVDDSGKRREVEYGASKRGFEPQGSDINVPPPTLTNNNPNHTPLGPNEVDDGQYREDPADYYKDQQRFNTRPIAPSNFRLNNSPVPAQPQYNPAPQYKQAPQYKPAPQSQYYNPAPVYQQPAPVYQAPAPTPPAHRFQQPQYYNSPQPHYNNAGPQQHHPALQNFDINSGSYSISYTGR